jgi:hypothetical protein
MLKAMTSERVTTKLLDFQTYTTKRDDGLKKLKDVLTYLHQHHADSLKHLSIFNSCVEVLHAAMDVLRLPEFKLHKLLIHQLKPEFRSEAFEEFLNNQTELFQFETVEDFVSEWDLQTLTRSLPNLTRLIISINSCEVFNRCVHHLDKLKHLQLRGVFKEGDLKLPKNLETFQMSSFTHPSNKTKVKVLIHTPMPSLTTEPNRTEPNRTTE